jgi:hypothetical protein
LGNDASVYEALLQKIVPTCFLAMLNKQFSMTTSSFGVFQNPAFGFRLNISPDSFESLNTHAIFVSYSAPYKNEAIINLEISICPGEMLIYFKSLSN